MKIIAPSRVHVSLIDLGDATQRKYGGIGFALNSPCTEVEISHRRDGISFQGFEYLDNFQKQDLNTLVEKFAIDQQLAGFNIKFCSAPVPHSGFGSFTSLALCIGLLINKFFSLNLEIEELQKLTGRGGTSGVGIHSFFSGGVVVDAGQKRTTDSTFSPSSFSKKALPSLKVQTILAPSSWRVALLIPAQGECIYGEYEKNFFEKNTPIPKGDVLDVMASVYHGLIPAIINRDIDTFKEALTTISTTGFKRREIVNQPNQVGLLIKKLNQIDGVASGMSSMGPLIYAIFEEENWDAFECINKIASSQDLNFFQVVEFNNDGFKIA
ncbi:hypothetical protein WH96_01155 [Kiloniella spongiae]|uniref:Beta-ribofuranosylaminobenzene 5'-phosphate synthase n=1 Tax=Kiloniella spongiae TaxID=1489064 RepID=A0A0H2MN12_9PROT|nr:beta-ribofuranosylaminobenzene 5'-phosphate synthase family protein [Kiloniella spongiae]KLN62172.1 hypothetical protein WH96_01155 [Kiloniella spongiae]